MVSCDRMVDFFDSDELVPYVERSPESAQTDGFVIKLENVDASWLDEEIIEKETAKLEKHKPKHPKAANKSGNYLDIHSSILDLCYNVILW